MKKENMIPSPLFMVIMGAPGAGKGTQVEIIAKKYNIPHISSGALLREVAKEDSPSGKSLKDFMERGELAPNDLIINIIRERLNRPDCKKGFIIDGFPRAKIEAEALVNMLEKENKKLKHVIEITISLEECIKRLIPRGRADDNPGVIEKRYNIYLKESKEVREYFKSQKNLYKEINGEKHVDDINQEIMQIIENNLN